MRPESEIIAMRDRLERYALQHYGLSNQGLAALAALRWVTDPTISDGELLAITAGDEIPRGGYQLIPRAVVADDMKRQ